MTNNQIKFVSENAAIVSKKFMENAMIYGTDEYRLYRSFKAENPNVTITIKTVKKNSEKNLKNLTYDNMLAYIEELENAASLKDEFKRTRKMACIARNQYRYVLNWFKSACFESEDEFNEYRKAASFFTKEDAPVALAA